MRLSILSPYAGGRRPGFVQLLVAAAPWLVIAVAALYALRA
ncbi:MAG: hypothetical protein ACOYM5_04295 [Caulobacter sp.]|jgi:hypothetical protein